MPTYMVPTYTLCAAFKSPSYQRSPSHDTIADSVNRLTVFNPTIQQHRNELRQLLSPETLPLSGISLRAVWPLAPAFILCVTCTDTDEKNNLEQGLIRELHQAGAYTVSLSFLIMALLLCICSGAEMQLNDRIFRLRSTRLGRCGTTKIWTC